VATGALPQLLTRAKARLDRYFDPASPLGVLRRVHALSIGSDTLMTMALAGSLFFAISPGEARSKVTLYLVFTMLPFAILAPLVAPVIDRGPRLRRGVVVASGLVRIVGVGLMIFALRSLLVFPLALMNLVASKAYLVAKSSLVPEILEADGGGGPSGQSLVGTNANLTLLAAVAGALAAVVGTGILKTPFLGPRVDLGLELLPLAMLVYEARALLRALPPRPERIRARRRLVRPSGPLYARTLTLSLVMSVLRGQVGFFAFLVAFSLKGEHAPTWLYGAALAASALGAGLATQTTPLARRRLGETAIVIVGGAGIAVAAFWAASTSAGVVGAICIAAVLGLGAQGAKIAFDASVQSAMSKHQYGRLFARYESGFQLSWVLGAFIATVAKLTLPDGELFLGATALLALASYGIATAALRHSGAEPSSDEVSWQ